MTLVLHRFRLSHYSEKARACLDFKALDYRVEDEVPFTGQIRVYRLSGQRKVPILEHDSTVVADSTEIGLYLERAFPDARRLLPADPDKRTEVLALEDRLDATFGVHLPLVAFLNADREAGAREAIKLGTSPLMATIIKTTAAAFRKADGILPLKQRLDASERIVRTTLADLTSRLETSKYLVGDEPSFADIAAVGLALPLKYPHSRYVAHPSLAGVVGNAIAEDPAYARFFAWRDQFYSDYLR
jgi:glutathione S-transferase